MIGLIVTRTCWKQPASYAAAVRLSMVRQSCRTRRGDQTSMLFAAAIHERPQDIILMGFDLLHLDGEDLRKEPLINRRARLEELLDCHDPGCRFQFSEHMAADVKCFFEAVDAMGLEGIVSKKANGRYRSGRTSPG